MAISVDTVYQRVLALANKEQRGYITPQEFNLLANQAQMSIFESYFYAKNQRGRTEQNKTNEVNESDIDELLDRKLGPFQSFEFVTNGHTFPPTVTVSSVAYDVFQTGVVLLGDEPCQKVSMHEAQRLRKSQRHMATTTLQAPIYTDSRVSGRDIIVYAGSATEIGPDFTQANCDVDSGDATINHDAVNALIVAGLAVSGTGIPIGATVASKETTTQFELSVNATATNDPVTLTFGPNMTVECFRVPKTVNWSYVVVNNKALFNNNPALAQDFELHKSEADTVVMKILELAGIVMNKPGLVQIAATKDASEMQIQNT
tara:strand:- start:1591 stop:2541 length:951 start_codon:yes stop_codon:yes gene_type:complete